MARVVCQVRARHTGPYFALTATISVDFMFTGPLT
jgi:hypothetical protein